MKRIFGMLVLAATCTAACAADTDGDEDVDATDADESALSANVRVESHFTDGLRPTRDETILNDLIRLIDKTPEGAEIRIAIHSITANPVQRALQRAEKNNVKVFVVHNGEDFDSGDATPKALAEALGASHRWCGGVPKGGKGGGCISSDPSSLMHSKLALFSKTEDETGRMRSDVVWFGSANLTWKTGANTYNNTVTVYGDDTLYTRFKNRYWKHLWEQDHFPRNDFFDAQSGRGYFKSSASGVTVFASPEQDGDLWMRQLDRIEPDEDCEIRVAHAMIHDSRMNVVRKLASLKGDGCRVKVTGNGIQDQALAALKKAKIPVHVNETHDKLMLVDAKFDGKRRKIVFTGSHNLTKSANDTNDELLVKVANPAIYPAYVAHFEQEFDQGKPR